MGFTVGDCRSIFNADGSLCVSGVVMQAIREGVNPKPHLQHDGKSYMAFSGDRSWTRMAEELYDFLYPTFTENTAVDAIITAACRAHPNLGIWKKPKHVIRAMLQRAQEEARADNMMALMLGEMWASEKYPTDEWYAT